MQLAGDYLARVSIFWLKQNGFINHDYVGTITYDAGYQVLVETHVEDYYPHLYLTYRYEGKSSDRQKISLTRTSCHLGGWRFWFQCPLGKPSGLTCGNITSPYRFLHS